MRVREFWLDSGEEIVSKIVREILLLFRVDVGGEGPMDAERLSVWPRVLPGSPTRVECRMEILHADGRRLLFRQEGELRPGEGEAAGIHRLVKRNLYDIFRRELHAPPAPWGILHGVRPTKIVHRWIRAGLGQDDVAARLQQDYRASPEKSRLLAEVAFRQLPFLREADERTVSVYVGIPFCLTRCLYCSFPSGLLPGEEGIRAFLRALQKDVAAARESVRRYGFRVQSIYVGGGTPTSLPDAFFAEMLEMVCDAFMAPSVREFTLEAGRPDSITEGKIRAMRELGVTRTSLNPQTMQGRTLERIGRRHTPEDAVAMFQTLRRAAPWHINMDLILGLPGETAADVEDTVQKVTALAPDSITLHALALKRGSRLKMQLADYELPGDEETRRMSEIAMGLLRSAGYDPYYLYRQGYMSGQLENVGCCRKGAECLYNIQIMEERQTVLGMGGAATSKIVDFRARRLRSTFHAKDLATYLRDLDRYIEKRTALLQETYGTCGMAGE